MTVPPKTTALPVKPENIPDRLKERAHWVGWRWAWDASRRVWTKPPLVLGRPDRLASSTDPATWSGFGFALDRYRDPHHDYDGIGYVVTPDDGLIGVDFDHVIRIGVESPIPDRVREAIRALAGYTEWSPSGTGLRVICRGTLPDLKGVVTPWMEMYPAGRYLTITGHILPGSPTEPQDAQDAIDGYREQFRGDRLTTTTRTPQRPHLITLSDLEVLDHCRRAKNGYKFSRLYDHADLSGYEQDHSRADLALVAMLGFFTEDRDQIDRLVRRSALNRGKWEGRLDYRERTVSRAEGGEHWTPPAPKPRTLAKIIITE